MPQRLVLVAGRLPAGERGGEFDPGLHGAAAGAVGVADRGRRLQVVHRRVEMAQRGGRLPERQLDRPM